ncbi:MAG: UDP-N-acetylmuramate dehydrogenase [Bdellovibrionales bacterium]|nr:UDP-N-acetylmuramate dehydrogenase [Bdellovibrionales bacterium]
MEIVQNKDLKKFSWWKVGGFAEYFCQPKDKEELKTALSWTKKNQKDWTVLGAGTNVLISDQGISGLVISTKKMTDFSFEKKRNSLFIVCQAGVLKSEVMKIFKKHKLAPALFLSGLPGDVAGGVVMNAGVGDHLTPHEFSEIVHSFKTMDFEGSTTYSKEDIKWSYRKSSGWKKSVIYEVLLKWSLDQELDLNDKIKQEIKKRRHSQPLSEASCGSVFKNPFPLFAGSLIEQAGLKGYQQGAVKVSQKHANFIINLGGATAQDIHKLITLVQKKVYDLFKVRLETEVHYLGFWKKRS